MINCGEKIHHDCFTSQCSLRNFLRFRSLKQQRFCTKKFILILLANHIPTHRSWLGHILVRREFVIYLTISFSIKVPIRYNSVLQSCTCCLWLATTFLHNVTDDLLMTSDHLFFKRIAENILISLALLSCQ